MRKNRVMALLIMVIVIVILTNFDKAAGKIVYNTKTIEESTKTIDYKFLKMSYQEDTDSSCLKAVDEVIKNLPAEVVTGISDGEIEIRITDKENADYYDENTGAILVFATTDKAAIRQNILTGYERLMAIERNKNAREK